MNRHSLYAKDSRASRIAREGLRFFASRARRRGRPSANRGNARRPRGPEAPRARPRSGVPPLVPRRDKAASGGSAPPLEKFPDLGSFDPAFFQSLELFAGRFPILGNFAGGFFQPVELLRRHFSNSWNSSGHPILRERPARFRQPAPCGPRPVRAKCASGEPQIGAGTAFLPAVC